MLAKKFRLSGEKEFKKIYNRGRYIPGSFVGIKYLLTEKQRNRETQEKSEAPKIAIVVSKKINNKATVRNKIKRQIGESIYSVIDKIPASIEMIVITKRFSDDFTSLKEDVIGCLRKIM